MVDSSLLLHPSFKKPRRVLQANNLADDIMVNGLLCFCVILMLWALWSGNDYYDTDTATGLSPYPDYYINGSTGSSSSSTTSSVSSEVASASMQLGSQPHRIVPSASTTTTQGQATSRLEQQQQPQQQQFVPVFLDDNGNPTAILIHPQQQQQQQQQYPQMTRTLPTSVSSNEKGSSFVVEHQALSSGVRRQTTPGTNNHIKTITNKEDSSRNGGSNADSTSYRQTPTTETRSPERGSSSSTTNTATPLLMVASGAIVLGALMAKRVIERAQQWEQESQEDSLAYDLAYTDTRSDVSYGSFVSTAWNDDLEKFDI